MAEDTPQEVYVSLAVSEMLGTTVESQIVTATMTTSALAVVKLLVVIDVALVDAAQPCPLADSAGASEDGADGELEVAGAVDNRNPTRQAETVRISPTATTSDHLRPLPLRT